MRDYRVHRLGAPPGSGDALSAGLRRVLIDERGMNPSRIDAPDKYADRVTGMAFAPYMRHFLCQTFWWRVSLTSNIPCGN
jgi:hypothetical protein